MATGNIQSGGILGGAAGQGGRTSRLQLGTLHAATFLLFLVVWWILSITVGHGFLPSPQDTAKAAVKMFGDGSLEAATLQSFFSLFCGFLLAVIVAIPVGMAMGGIAIVGAVLNPYVDALSSMPRIAFLPLIIVFLGLGYEAKIFMVFLGAVMPILINTYAGVRHSDGELIEMARSAGAGDADIFRKIVLPGALPHIMTGLRVGASLALINTVVAELYTAVSGLGGLLSIYGNSFRMAPYFVIVAILAGMGMLLMYGIRLIEKRVMRWRIERS
ncbi:MAG: transporter permease [Rhodospirillales bacterium]|nr:transporter permease [Rhodospirillales bacterium]